MALTDAPLSCLCAGVFMGACRERTAWRVLAFRPAYPSAALSEDTKPGSELEWRRFRAPARCVDLAYSAWSSSLHGRAAIYPQLLAAQIPRLRLVLPIRHVASSLTR